MNQLIVLTSAKEELFMNYTNAELIKMGAPISAVLPGSAFWIKNKVFKSNTAILNFDPVSTSKSGSTITLGATKPDLSGSLGGIILLKGAVNMSAAKDSIIVKCTNRGLSSRGASLSLGNPEWLKIPVTLNLGNGNNSVLAGLGYSGWDTGIDLAGGTRLLGGTGNDIIRGSGKEIGIYVRGTISTGAGNDIIEGRSDSVFGIYVGEGSLIDMGAGNDRLTGIGKTVDQETRAIYSNGWIDMGDGDDEITGTSFMISGAVAGQAKLLMGSGDDKLIATLHSSNAPIDFGSGIDKLYLPSGQYEITDLGGGSYSLLSTGAKQGVYGAERISGLELIVSKSTGAEYVFAAGTLTVS